MSRVDVYHGDSREMLKLLPDASVHAVVTDPPYALVSIQKRFGADASAPHRKEGPHARASAGFMGESWDTGETAFAVEFWREVRRVLKPGGHIIAFSATRTYHRLACAIEDADFEIRDMIPWLYGSGFPKSRNAAKAVAQWRTEDFGAVREVCRHIRATMDRCEVKSADLVGFFGDCNPRLIDHWAARDTDSQPSLPTLDQWLILKEILPLGGELDSEVIRLNGRKGQAGDAWSGADIIGEHDGVPGGFGETRFKVTDASIRELGGEAAKWIGFGTQLKPALEPAVLARKPFSGNLASNLLEYGCGALNIAACRIDRPDAPEDRNISTRTAPRFSGVLNGEVDSAPNEARATSASREGGYPANLTHDGSPAILAGFPPETDGQSPARFFYSAKADREDRLGSDHPTVKPVDLMAWHVRLICPPGGTVLDPFAGSGTTGLAALAEGRDAILIEREADHADDIRRRLAWARGEGALTSQEMLRHRIAKDPAKAAGAGTPLFGEPQAHAVREAISTGEGGQ